MSKTSKYQKVKSYEDKRRQRKEPQPRRNFDSNGGVICKGCFELRQKNEILVEEIKNLRARLVHFERTSVKDVANAHTPSSKIHFKSNSKEDLRAKKGGAVKGHKGFGRAAVEGDFADGVTNISRPKQCPECECSLNQKDIRDRTVIESTPLIAKKIVYRCERGICPKCMRVYASKPPTLPKCLYGNSLIAQSLVMHFVHGITLGKVLEILGSEVSLGGLIECFHRIGKMAATVKDQLVKDYRESICKHADETGWRTDGHSGYAWIFCTPRTTIFEFRNTRAKKIPLEILGTKSLDGVLVVDRYPAYNGMLVDIQYCYAHLLREVEKLEIDFNESKVVTDFTGQFAEYLTQAMKLRGLSLTDEEYYRRASAIQTNIQTLVSKPSQHLGVRRIQEIFLDQRDRLYHWVKNREIPAENNRAERELRPTVIARKVSFGSQSDAGAQTRSSIMSLLYTVKKRLKDQSIEEWIKNSLDQISTNPSIELVDLLPPVNPQ